jgi:hypothetical protein
LRTAIGGAVAFLFVASTAATVRAQTNEPPPRALSTAPVTVRVVPPDCVTPPPFAVSSFLEILAAELRSDGVSQVIPAIASAPDGTQALTTIHLSTPTCDPTTSEIIVTIEDNATSKRVARQIPLGDVVPSARPRALALAVAELLRACWLELTMLDVPPARVPVPPAVREAVMRRMESTLPVVPREGYGAASPADHLRAVSLAVAWRAFPSTRLALYGGRAWVAVPFFTPSILFRADGAAIFGAAQDPLGSVRVGQATGSAAMLLASPRDTAVTAAIGPRLELGVAWASGNPVDPATSSYAGSGFVATASLVSTFGLRISPTWRVTFEIEGGATIAPVQTLADRRIVTGIDGAMLGLAFGLTQWR